jgi:hypothetical protein
MPDLITLAIPAFLTLLFAEAIAGTFEPENPGWRHDDPGGANSDH